MFALGPVGFTASTSQLEFEFKQILAPLLQSDRADGEALLAGNPQAISYALVGMRKLDRKRYAELARFSDR